MVALNVIGVNLISPVLPSYAAHFGVGFAAASTLVTVFAMARMSMRLTAGSLADRIGSRFVCALGGTVQAVGALVAAFAPGLGILLLARGIQGTGSSLFGTSVNRYLLVQTDKAELGTAVAGFQGGILIGSTIGPLIGGIVADRFGIFAPFYVQAGVATMLAIVTFSVIRDTGRKAPTKKAATQSVRSLLAIRGFKVLMLLGFGLFFIRAGAVNVLLPAFSDDVLAMSPTKIGGIISVSSIVSLIVMPFAGHLADSLGRMPVALIGALGTAISVAMFGLAQSVAGVLLVSGIVGVGMGFASVAMPTMIGDLAPEGTEGKVSGVYRMANDMGWIVGPVTLGLLADSSQYGLAFLLAGLPLFIGGLVLFRFRNRVSASQSN